MKCPPAPLLICAMFLLCSCAASPEPRYYTLSASTDAERYDAALKIKVRRPTLPITLDRPEMVTQNGNFLIEESEGHLWSEPLDTMIERIFAEDLRARLPASLIVTESSRIPLKADDVIDIDIQQLGTDADGYAVLQAQAIIRRPDGRETSFPVMLRGARISSAQSMAKALSALLGGFSNATANRLRNFHP